MNFGLYLGLNSRPAILGACLAFSLTASAATRHVWSGGSGLAPYDTWPKAAQTIQAALTGATAGDVILVTNGTYTSADTVIATITNAITLRSVNGPAVTVLDAQGTGSTDRRCIRLMPTATGAVVSGLKLKGVDYSLHSFNGGAVYLEAVATVTNCVMENNRTGGRGAGVYMIAAGLVTDCVFTNNRATEWNYGYGGAVYLNQGNVQHCVMVDNACWGAAGGGAVYMDNGTVQNCLIIRNQATRSADPSLSVGGGVRIQNGTLSHCTIVGNWSKGLGGGVYQAGGSVVNCIVYGNTVASDNPYTARNVYLTGGSFSYSCADPLVGGTGNIAVDPLFALSHSMDYRLLPGSPAMDVALPGIAQDLDHGFRPWDGDNDTDAIPDLGCYEMPAVDARPFTVAFSMPTNEGISSLDVRFTASVVGTNRVVNDYAWSFGDGTTNQGPGLGVVDHTYTTGWYTVGLTVSNALLETATHTWIRCIRVAGPVAYVNTTGSELPPYASVATASRSVEAAIGAACVGPVTSTWVQVDNGTYLLTNTLPVNRGVKLRSVSGWSNTVFQAAGLFRCADLADADAMLDGFSLIGPDWNTYYYWGGAVRLYAGLITNCWIRNTRLGGAGGGIYQQGGIVSHCLFTSNRVTEWQLGYGGAIYQTGGRVEYSRFAYNWTESFRGGGAIYMTQGTIRNCLFYTNRATRIDAGSEGRGGAIAMTAGLIENSTLADNYSYGPGGGLYMTGGAVTNCIVYHNTVNGATPSGYANIYRSAGTIGFTGSSPLEPGTNNTSLVPEFINRAAADYRIPATSPAADAGTNLAWMTAALDLQGDARIIHGVADMGAYESPDPASGPLICSFTATPDTGFSNLTVVLAANVGGMNTNITWYGWDIGNTGSWTFSGPGYGVITQQFAAGYHSVRLVVSNTAPASATSIRSNVVQVAPAILYVSTNGTPVPPYLDWPTAARYIQDAIDAASADPSTRTHILVGPGTYTIGSSLGLTKPIRLSGFAGREQTRIQSTGPVRCFSVNQTNAILDSLTLQNCDNTGPYFDGGGVFLVAGLVTNCVLYNHRVGGRGGGIYMSGGRVVDCVFTNNRCTEWQYGHGGAAYVSGGEIWNSRFTHNWTESHQGGGAVYLNGGRLVNCLVVSNQATRIQSGYEGDGGGILLKAGRVESCTIVGNTAVKEGGGVKIEAVDGGMTNCVVWSNRVTTLGAMNIENPVRIAYSTSPDLVDGADGNTTNPPRFAWPAQYDFTLQSGSGGQNTGTNFPWMTRTSRDLLGRYRVRANIVDMGAFEYQPPSGTILQVR